MLYPKANKTNMVRLLRAKGFDIPSSRLASFSQFGRSFFLRWRDKQKDWHLAHYTAVAYQPALLVDNDLYELTMADVLHHGLVEEVEPKVKK